MGAHSSDPVLTGCFGENREHNCRETPRDGLGNVARNDSMDHDVEGRCSDGQTSEDNCDSGGHLSDHGCVAAAAPLPGFEPEVQPDCTLDPQEVHGPEPES
jgi:hypothetical protein